MAGCALSDDVIYVYDIVRGSRKLGMYETRERNTERARDEMLLSDPNIPVETELRNQRKLEGNP